MSTVHNYHNNRDLIDRRSAPAICQIAASCLCSSLLLFNGQTLWAQPAFAPPPPPRASGVRGIYDPALPPPSPANIAAPASQQPAAGRPATQGAITPTPLDGVQPLEGGEIIARIDGEIVMASDVLWQVKQMIAANRDRIPPEKINEVHQAFLRQQVMGLIDTKLLYADFRRTVPAENIPPIEENLLEPFEENEIPRLVKALELEDRRELVELLENFGSSLSDVQRQFNEKTIAGEWLKQSVAKPKPVTHQDMLDYYQEHLEEYDYTSQAKWEELMLRFDRFESDRAATWSAIAEIGNELWQQVVANPQVRGAVFTQIAKEKSHGFTAKEGGQHDWITRGSLRSKTIDKAIFSLQVGQLSNILESEDGFHIVRVLERKDAGRTSFVEAQAKIRQQIENERRRGLFEAALVKLRKKSRVWTVFDGDISGPELSELLEQKSRR